MSGRRASIIADRLGDADAAQLSRLAGGTRLAVPASLDKASRFKALLGERLAVRVILHFGDSRLYVPVAARCAQVDLRKVKRLVNRGLSSARIARELKCSERTVDAKRAKLRSRAKPNLPKSGDDNGSAQP